MMNGVGNMRKSDMSEWQPIETAPKHKQIICAHEDHRWIRFGILYPELPSRWYYSTTNERNQFGSDDPPTHWMPLPEPPKKETAR